MNVSSKLFQMLFAHPDNVRIKAQAPIIKDCLQDITGKWGIDIGCGTGRFTKFLAHSFPFVVGIDPNPDALNRVRQKNINSILIRGKVNNLPFVSKTFDVALLLEVLEHIENDRGGLYEVERILKPGGKLILSTPCPPAVYPDMLHKRNGYTRESIFELLENVGFKVISYKFCMYRLSRMVLKFAVTFMSVFKFPPPILFVLKLEHWLKKPPPFDIIVKAKK